MAPAADVESSGIGSAFACFGAPSIDDIGVVIECLGVVVGAVILRSELLDVGDSFTPEQFSALVEHIEITLNIFESIFAHF